MTSPDMDDEAMKMADRIVSAALNSLVKFPDTAGEFRYTMKEIALAAIIETQELIAQFVGAHSRHADPADIARAIRSGQKFRKDV